MTALATRPVGPAPTRDRLERACDRLRRHGILAVGEAGGDPDVTRARLAEALQARFPAASGALVFWTAGAFDDAGDLIAPLTLHHAGPGVVDAVRAALAEQGLSVRDGSGPHTVCVTP